jgi:hypothetical protein
LHDTFEWYFHANLLLVLLPPPKKLLPPRLCRCGLLPALAVEVSAKGVLRCLLSHGHSTKLSTDTPQLTLAKKPKREEEQPIEDEAEADEKGQLQAMPSSRANASGRKRA